MHTKLHEIELLIPEVANSKAIYPVAFLLATSYEGWSPYVGLSHDVSTL